LGFCAFCAFDATFFAAAGFAFGSTAAGFVATGFAATGFDAGAFFVLAVVFFGAFLILMIFACV
jgi:hypothetical protein